MKKNILIVPSHDAALLEYIRLFENLPETLKPIFYLSYESKYRLKIERLGWDVYSAFSTKGDKPLRTTKIRQSLKFLLDDTKFGCFVQRYVLLNMMTNRLKKSILKCSEKFIQAFKENEVTTLVISNDRTFGVEAAAAYAAKELGVKIVVPAFAYSATYESCYKLRTAKVYDAKYSVDKRNVMYSNKKGSKAFFKPFVSKALTELGLHLENPWVLGGGFANYVLLDSEREKDRIISYGGRECKYIVTGIAAHDDVYKNYLIKDKLKEEVLIETSMTDSASFLVLALPQYYEHKLMEKEEQLEIYRDLFDKLAQLDYNVIISLHPKSNPDDYSWIDKVSKNLIISKRPLTELVTIADVFVGTYTSTISWALLCEIPCIIVDHPELNFIDFYSEFKLPVCKNNDELIQLLLFKKFTNITSERLISKISIFDGSSRARIASFM